MTARPARSGEPGIRPGGFRPTGGSRVRRVLCACFRSPHPTLGMERPMAAGSAVGTATPDEGARETVATTVGTGEPRIATPSGSGGSRQLRSAAGRALRDMARPALRWATTGQAIGTGRLLVSPPLCRPQPLSAPTIGGCQSPVGPRVERIVRGAPHDLRRVGGVGTQHDSGHRDLRRHPVADLRTHRARGLHSGTAEAGTTSRGVAASTRASHIVRIRARVGAGRPEPAGSGS